MNIELISRLESGLKIIGDEIKSWRNNEDSRSILEPKEFKTKADIQANKLIKDLLLALYPHTDVISEEDVSFNMERPQKYWLLDPIDGTASWYDGYDGFVTQLAYIENDAPIYGAVYAPVLDKFWTARKGSGAFLNGKKMSNLEFHSRLNLIDNYPNPKRVAKYIFDNAEVSKYIECGSLGLKSCLVADGTADLFIKDVVVRDWDIAPVAVIIEEVGGYICGLKGQKIQFNGSFENLDGLIVCRDLNLKDQVLRLIDEMSVSV